MKKRMTSLDLQRTFRRFDKQYFSNALKPWTVTCDGEWQGLYGETDNEERQIFIRLETHHNDEEVEATLIHEMAHAVTTADHDDRWATEMARLKAAGAPTDPLDFIPHYDENRWLVTSVIDYARGRASWEEALSELLEDAETELRRVCKDIFERERRNVVRE